VLGHPLVAVALGVLLGVVLTLVAERAASFVTPENPSRGLTIVALATGVRMVMALAALGAYFVSAPSGLPVFGFTLGVTFIAGLALEAVRASRIDAPHTSA